MRLTDEQLVKAYNPKATSLNPNHVKGLKRAVAAALEALAETGFPGDGATSQYFEDLRVGYNIYEASPNDHTPQTRTRAVAAEYLEEES